MNYILTQAQVAKALKLRDQGCTTVEIAVLLGIPTNAVQAIMDAKKT